MSREMKDSGIDWVGVIPQNWETKKYKDIAVIMNGYPFDSASFDLNEGKPIIRIRDITSGNIETYFKGEYDKKYIVKKEDIIVGMDGDFNIRRWDNIDALLNQRCFKISANISEVNNWIYYQLPFCLKIINDNTYATTVKHLSHYSVLNSKIVMPPAKQIKRTISYLDRAVMLLDTIIEKTKSTIEDYKLLKQSIITEAVTKGLDKNVEMKDSGIEWIGEIPKRWMISKIKYDCYLKGRIGWQGLTSNEYIDEGPYLITGKDFENGNINWGTCVHISEQRYREAPDIHVKNEDVLITKDGTVGKVAVIDNFYGEASLNSGVLLIRNISKRYQYRYLYYVLVSDVFKEWYERIKPLNSTILHLYQGDFKDFSYPIPSIDEQNDITSYLDKETKIVDDLIKRKEQLLVDLEEYKKSIIYEYVTGKKEVE